MTQIHIDADTVEGTVKQIQKVIGGTIEQRWGEYKLTVDNEMASGGIRCIKYDRGMSLLDYNIMYFDDVELVIDTSLHNPINFVYCLKGFMQHRFRKDTERKTLEQFQSVIISGKDGGYTYSYYPKNKKLEINIIQVTRKNFLKKRINHLHTLNERLHKVFLDEDHENNFAYYGTYSLNMADQINELHTVDAEGMIRILRIEGMIYQILSIHIQQHDRALNNDILPTTLTKKELKIVRNLAKKILKDISRAYSLELLSEESGLSQAKLQEGFKLLYARTVNEYIRNVRLELARDLMSTSDLNISEIVYSIGLSSRSYFSKIFREKYDFSPSEFMKRLKTPVDQEGKPL